MKISRYISFVVLVFFCAGCASDVNTFARKITAKDLREHLTVIAGDSLEGREMTSVGEKKASGYIAATFRSLDLLPAPGTVNYLQSFSVLRDSIVTGRFLIDTQQFTVSDAIDLHSKDSVFDLSCEKICFAGYGIDDPRYSDYGGVDVKGMVVAFFPGEPMTDTSHYLITGNEKRSQWSQGWLQFTTKTALAMKKGAKAVIILDTRFDTIPKSWSINTSGAYYLPKAATVDTMPPYVHVMTRVTKYLLGQQYRQIIHAHDEHLPLREYFLLMNKKFTMQVRKTTIAAPVNNVVGYIEGADKKEEYVIVSAHYDHLGKHGGEIYHGADDNGSGTCGLMGIAKAFSEAARAGLRPRRSIVFLSVTGEEKGLFGSKNYVAHPCFPLAETVVDINTDMIGRYDPAHEKDSNYVYIIGDTRLSSELRAINEQNNAEHIKLALDYKYDSTDDPNRFYYRSDHYEFAKRKIPIIFYFDGIHKDYHRPTDTIEKIDFDLMERRSRLAFYTTWEIANRETRLKADKSGE